MKWPDVHFPGNGYAIIMQVYHVYRCWPTLNRCMTVAALSFNTSTLKITISNRFAHSTSS